MKKIKDMKFLLLIITTLFLIIFNAKISYAYSSNEPSSANNNVPVAGNPVVGQVYWKFDTDTLYLNNTQVDASYVLIDETLLNEENSTYTPWEMHNENIVYVNIENIVKPTILARYFWNLNNLIEIYNIGNLDTSNTTNMNRMFEGCFKLTNIDLSSFNTSKVTNMMSMFASCGSIQYLDLSSFDTSNVIDMSGMFSFCEKLLSLDLSSFNTSKVTKMSTMFLDCKNLEKLNVTSFNTINVTDMWNMFAICENLQTIDLSNFNTSNVISMRGMFLSSGLISLDLSSFDTSKVTNMNSMFAGCIFLKDLNISSFNTSNVDDMRQMFLRCKNLTSLNLSHFDTHLVTHMIYMFEECTNLKFLDISSFDMTNVEIYDLMFENANSLEILKTPAKGLNVVELPGRFVDINDANVVYNSLPATTKTLIPFTKKNLLNMSDTIIHFSKMVDNNKNHGQQFNFRVYHEDGRPTNIVVKNDSFGDIYVDTKTLEYGKYYIKEEIDPTSPLTFDKSRYYFEIKKETVSIPGKEFLVGPSSYSLINSDILKNKIYLKKNVNYSIIEVKDDNNGQIFVFDYFPININKDISSGDLGNVNINPTEEKINQVLGFNYNGPHKGELAKILRTIMYYETSITRTIRIYYLLYLNAKIDLSKYGIVPDDYEYAIVESKIEGMSSQLIDLKTAKYDVYENGINTGIKEARNLIIENQNATFNNRTNTPEYEIKIEKKDMFGNMLEGATFKITKIDGTILDLWVTTKDIKTIKLIDGEYIIKEVKSPDGYEINNKEIKFKIENGKIIEIEKDNNYNIKDNIITITNIQKTEENPNTGSFIFKDIIMLGTLALIIGGLYLLNKKNIFIK